MTAGQGRPLPSYQPETGYGFACRGAVTSSLRRILNRSKSQRSRAIASCSAMVNGGICGAVLDTEPVYNARHPAVLSWTNSYQWSIRHRRQMMSWTPQLHHTTVISGSDFSTSLASCPSTTRLWTVREILK